MRFILALAILLATSTAHAQYRCVRGQTTAGSHVWLNDAALDSPKSFVLDIAGASLLSVDLQYTHDANGTLTLTCTGKSAPDSSGAQADTTLTTCTVSSGTCTLSFAGVFTSPALTDDAAFNVLVGVAGQEQVTCTVSHGGSPTSDDRVTATGRLCTH